MKRIFLLILLLMTCLAGGQTLINESFDGWQEENLPNGWKFQIFNNSDNSEKVKIKKYKHEGKNAILLLGTSNTSLLTSLFYEFKGVKSKIEKELIVGFEYNCESKNMPLFIALSTGPGCGAPAIKNYPDFKFDGKWHRQQVVFNTNGLVSDTAVIEFILEGDVKKDDKLYIANIVVEQNRLPEQDAFLFTPGSLTIIDKTPTNQIGLELTSRKTPAFFTVSVTKQHEEKSFIEKKIKVSSSQKCWLDFSSFDVGEYVVRVANGAGAELGKWNINKVPFKNHSVWIKDHVPYVNGKPFLTLGLFHVGDPEIAIVNDKNQKLGWPAITRSQVLKDIKKRGFNTVFHGWSVASTNFLKDAANNGLMVISENCSLDVNKIEDTKNDPALLGWHAYDEPVNSRADFCAGLYQEYRKKDPYHLVTVSFNSGGLGFGRNRLLDIALPDAYPVRSKDSGVATIATFIKTCYEQINYDPSASVIAVIQLFTQERTWNSFEPSLPQVRAETFTAFAAGAKGVLYYAWYSDGPLKNGMPKNKDRTHWFIPESGKLWDDIHSLLDEVKSYENFILFGKNSEQIKILHCPASVNYRIMMLENEVLVVIVNSDSQKTGDMATDWPAGWPDPMVLSGPPVTSGEKQINLSGYEISILKFKL